MIGNMKGKEAGKKNEWLNGFFSGKDVYIIGGGKSAEKLPTKVLKKLEKADLITCGLQSKRFPNPQICIIMDRDVPDKLDMPGHWPYGEKFHVLAGPLSGLRAMGNVSRFEQRHNSISRDPSCLLSDCSGLAALNAAVIGGAKRIFLVGIDGGFGLIDKGAPAPLMGDPNLKLLRKYIGLAPLFEKFARRYENIYRTTQQTNLPFFPYMDLEVSFEKN